MIITPTSFLPIPFIMLIALLTTAILLRCFKNASTPGLFTSIDGLRGYLAFFVYIHHSCIWYFYLKTGNWVIPPSHLYTHLGQTSVALFFMITGFLFFSKVLDGRKNKIDWPKLYLSRVFRITPMYLFALFVLFIIVYVQTNGVLNTLKLPKEILQWLTFTILGVPNINGLEHTSIIIASVQWTLRYEWFFYLLLPIFALLTRTKPPVFYIIISLLILCGLYKWELNLKPLTTFLGGIISAVLIKSEKIRNISTSNYSSILVILFVTTLIIFFPTTNGVIQFIILSLMFLLIAGGNTLFGILTHPVSRYLGEFSYSIYLLHGIVLYTIFNFIFGINVVQTFTPFKYWSVIALISPVVIVSSFITYQLIEKSSMKKSKQFYEWLCMK